MKKYALILVYCLSALLGAYMGYMHSRRSVDTSRMENCLIYYQQYQKDQNQESLKANLAKIGFTPLDFQHIIDRFIYYRSRKSALKQAISLLQAFKAGYKIEVQNVVKVNGMDDEPFRLDAEVLAVFEKNPKLIDKAFEG